jgi:biotin carboxyl carrier protein
VSSVLVAAGQQVEAGSPLVVVETAREREA